MPDGVTAPSRGSFSGMRTELRIVVDGEGVSPDTMDAAAFFELAARFARAVADVSGTSPPFRLRPGGIEKGSAQGVLRVEADDDAGLRAAEAAALRVAREASNAEPENAAVRSLQDIIARDFSGLRVFAVANDVRAEIAPPKREAERKFPASVETWRAEVVGARVGNAPGVTVKIDGRSVDLRCPADVAKQLGGLLEETVHIEAKLVRADDHRRRYQVLGGELCSYARLRDDISVNQALREWATPPRTTPRKGTRARVAKG